jgi:hypothetical protein
MAVVGAVAVLLAGCSSQVAFRPLHIGECLPSSAQIVGDREPAPPVVACSKPHRYEVYATPDLGITSWPGQSTAYARAKSLCYAQFQSGTGWNPLDLPDGVEELTIDPSEQAWTSGKDRSVECLVVLPKDRRGSFIRTSPSPTS